MARVIQLTPAAAKASAGTPAQPRLPKPEWLKVRAPGSPSYLRLKGLMRELKLHTVCEEAQCPNIGECWNHGTETVPRLYRMARSGGRYARTLELLDRSRRYAPEIPTKTGVMVGLGEEPDELVATFEDLRKAGCGILTIGQYLRPSAAHAAMVRYYHPEEFANLKRI